MAVSLTDNAIAHIRRQLEKRGKGRGLRLGVRRNGCSGWSYELDYVDEINEGEQVFEQGDLVVAVPADALPLVDGTEVDYISEGLNQMFQFRNPNVSDECGCGESFAVGS
ncbi:MAG: iron-sulfur cluster assembly accessory protein [Gammaproteobacteria bacterium]|nr:iron-sulfur cluster assembly accessory protein [Gammaproteobacteria bacterium]